MQRSPIASGGSVLRLGTLWTLGLLALACLLLTLAGTLGRSDQWVRLDLIGVVPPERPELAVVGPFTRTDEKSLVISGGGLAFWYSQTVVTLGNVHTGREVTRNDGVSAVLALADAGVVHVGDWSGSYPQLPPLSPRSERYGALWFGILISERPREVALVVPLPLIAMAAGAWPVYAGWRWWRRRRRGENASGFAPVMPDRAIVEGAGEQTS